MCRDEAGKLVGKFVKDVRAISIKQIETLACLEALHHFKVDYELHLTLESDSWEVTSAVTNCDMPSWEVLSLIV